MKTTILTIIAAVLLAGCMSPKTSNELVPKTRFSSEGKGAKTDLELPKDMNIGYAQYTRPDGTTLVLSNVVSVTNPDVVKTSGDAQAQGFEAAAKLFQAGAQYTESAITKTLQLLAASQGVPTGLAGGQPPVAGIPITAPAPVVAKSATPQIPGKESLKIGDVVYTLIQEPNAAGEGIYIYTDPTGKLVTPKDGKMIPLP